MDLGTLRTRLAQAALLLQTHQRAKTLSNLSLEDAAAQRIAQLNHPARSTPAQRARAALNDLQSLETSLQGSTPQQKSLPTVS